MANVEANGDEEMVDESYMSQTDNGKKSCSEMDGDACSYSVAEGRPGNGKPHRKIKKSHSKIEKVRKLKKRTAEEFESQSQIHQSDTVEEFTMWRSLKISKEREDIVDPRVLGSKVATFWGITPAQVQERILQDIETISNAVTNNYKSESDGISNSPQKDSERDNRSNRGGKLLLKGMREAELIF